MKGYLVGYDSTGIYRIYHPETNTIKVSRDVIFCEDEFINKRRVKSTDNLIKNDSDSEAETLVNDDSSDSTSVISDSEQNDTAPPIIHNKIVVQPPPEPNRRQRRAFAKLAKAFVASL